LKAAAVTKATRARRAARGRRSATEARRAILDAATRCLVEGGPDAIRLQKIAADAGISHPAILHHFKSREGLIEAMVIDGFAKLQAQFVEGWPSVKEPDIEGTFDRFYTIASDHGVARLMAWLILSGHTPGAEIPGMLRRAAERLHAGRVRRAAKDGLTAPPIEQSLFGAAFLAIIVLGDSLFGPTMRAAVDLRSKEDAARFHRWLIKIVERMDRR
jgi:AcrR family transcriptional regulator